MSSLPLQISNHLLDNQFSMSEYFTGIGDWDSQTVARGCINGFSTTFMDKDNPPTYFAPVQQDHDFLMSTFPDLFETSTVLDDEFLNPFASQQTILSSSSPSSSSSVSFSRGEREPEKEPFTVSPVVADASTAHHGVKYKRRKNQHKRVVVQVTAEDLSSDVWAWRKYGQKPIKGSPHPRSYYRCSSSKGCLARKQVERSLLDPEMFVITYTAEHCHGHPTRRNSLAGTTRHKFSKNKSSSTTSGGNPNTPTPPPKYSCSSLATVEDYELSRQGIILKKESSEEEEEDQRMVGASEHNGLVTCDMILNDDFLMGFDELDRLLSFGLEAYNGDLLEQCPLTFPS